MLLKHLFGFIEDKKSAALCLDDLLTKRNLPKHKPSNNDHLAYVLAEREGFEPSLQEDL